MQWKLGSITALASFVSLTGACALSSTDSTVESHAPGDAHATPAAPQLERLRDGSPIHQFVQGVEDTKKLYAWMLDILGATPQTPEDQILAKLNGLDAELKQLKPELDQINQEIRNLIWSEFQSDWDSRVGRASVAQSQAATALDQANQWIASGKSDAGLLDNAVNNSALAANALRIDPTLFRRPASVAGQPEVFEYRMALTAYVYAITVRMAVIIAKYPNFRNSGDSQVGPLRQELETHAARLTEILTAMQAEVSCTSAANYDRYNRQLYQVCSQCTDPLAGVQSSAGGHYPSGWNPTCEDWLPGTPQDMNNELAADVDYDRQSVNAQIGITAGLALRDAVHRSSKMFFCN
jgi:hypothetical protein